MPTTRLLFPLIELPQHGVEVDATERQTALADALAEVGDGPGARTIHTVLHVEPTPQRIEVRGRFDATLPLRCARCVEPFAWSGGAEFRQVLLRSGDDREEVELDPDQLDASELIGDVLDLAALVREELLLALPDKPLCREDCKGICARCGAELNREACTCAPEVDPRWGALKGWTPRSTGKA